MQKIILKQLIFFKLTALLEVFTKFFSSVMSTKTLNWLENLSEV